MGKTKKFCNVDNDEIFQTALEQSVKYKPGQVSFSLYNSEGTLTAEATPYLVWCLCCLEINNNWKWLNFG